jgi:opacity protein-like surface antigen
MGRIVVIFSIFFTSNAVYAEDISSKFGVGGNWFYYLSNENGGRDINVVNEDTAETGNVHLSYCLPKPSDVVNLNLVLDWEWISRDINFDEDVKLNGKIDPLSDDFGTLTMMPIMLTFQLRMANIDIVTPYIGAGAGVSFNSISRGEFWDDFEEMGEKLLRKDLDLKLEVEDSFCFKIPLGIDVFIMDYLAFNLEAKYFYIMPRVKVEEENIPKISTIFDEDLNQNTFAFGAGLTFYF